MYSLCNHVLSEVDTAKYLGINLSSELSWSPHVSSVVSKANSTLGFLGRNLRKCPSKLKETAYLSLVRSTLEYAATLWDPYYVRDIDSLEQVQRRAARFTTGDYHTTSSVTAMLAELGWKRLEDRRKDLRLALLYKIVHGHVAVPVDALNLEPPDPRTRKKHKYTYKHLTPHTDPYKHFFSVPHYSGVELSPCQRCRGYICWVLQDSFGRPSQRDQPWSGTPTHPRHTPEEDCGLRYQTRPVKLRCLTPEMLTAIIMIFAFIETKTTLVVCRNCTLSTKSMTTQASISFYLTFFLVLLHFDFRTFYVELDSQFLYLKEVALIFVTTV